MDFTIIEKGFNHQTDRKTIRKIDQKSIDRLGVEMQFSQEGSRGSTHSYMGNAYPLDIQLDIQLLQPSEKPGKMSHAHRDRKIAYAMIKGWPNILVISTVVGFIPSHMHIIPTFSPLICIPITWFPIFIPYIPRLLPVNYW